jgi:hypothetical protein
MKKKIIKVKSELFQREVTLTIDEKLNSLKGIDPAPELTAEANKALEKMRNMLNK